MYDFSRKSMSVSALVKGIKSNKIRFDMAIQRGEVWDNYRKSLLIHSILIGIPIEPLLVVYNPEAKDYAVIQGKQRSLALYDIVEKGKKLHAEMEPVLDDAGNSVEIAKKKFTDLPTDLQERIKEYTLDIWRFEQITDDEMNELFFRINYGKPLTAIELTRTKTVSLSEFQKIANHEAFTIAISDAARRKFFDEKLIIQSWIMCFKENPSMLSAQVKKHMQGEEISDEEARKLNNALNYLLALYNDVLSDKKLLRKMKTPTHIVSLIYMATLADKNGLTEDEYIEKAKAFFSPESEQTTISDAYNEAAGKGSAKPEQVRIRMAEIEKAIK